ncbi:MAG: hypothetical protein GX789_07770 [Pseudomonas formosensis]|nr:hypothetical protein [Halopseudomonas formosensis]
MYRWVGLLLLIATFAANGQESCRDSVADASLPTAQAAEGQTLLLAGKGRLALDLGKSAETIAHLPEMLIVKFADGATLSHRWMAPSELREDQSSDLPFVDFVRLVFREDVSDAPSADRDEADAVWRAMVSGCIDARHYQLAGTDLFTYSQTRASGERYHAFFILDDDLVHYLDVLGSDSLADALLAGLRIRDRAGP